MIRKASPRYGLPPMLMLALACMMATPASAGGDGKLPSGPDTLSGSTADELRTLTDGHQLAELRTTRNGDYAASLLFQADKLSYYVALSRSGQYWRIIQTDAYDDAEGVYRSFAAQTQKLAQVDIDALRLRAGNTYAEHLVALNQQRLQNLQRDADYRQQQARQVALLQRQARQQAVSLSTDLRATSAQLDAVQERIHALEAEQTNPALILPPPAPAAPAAPAAATSSPSP